MPMKKPPHPGRILKQDCLEPLALSVTDGANALGVTRLTLSRIINQKSGISPEMALRLEQMGWGSADLWVRMQAAYDLSKARLNSDHIVVETIPAS